MPSNKNPKIPKKKKTLKLAIKDANLVELMILYGEQKYFEKKILHFKCIFRPFAIKNRKFYYFFKNFL